MTAGLAETADQYKAPMRRNLRAIVTMVGVDTGVWDRCLVKGGKQENIYSDTTPSQQVEDLLAL